MSLVFPSGQTSHRIAYSLSNHFSVRIAGLIALADIRTIEDRNSSTDLEKVYDERIVCLYNETGLHCEDLKPNYYVHPETIGPT